MSRSGYSEDYGEQYPNELEFYRTRVANAIGGKRGQAFLRDLVTALDAMPDKKLIADELQDGDGLVCAIGSVGVMRGVDMTNLDPHHADEVAKAFNIAECLAREIVFENDERPNYWSTKEETPEARWQRMHDWAIQHLKETTP